MSEPQGLIPERWSERVDEAREDPVGFGRCLDLRKVADARQDLDADGRHLRIGRSRGRASSARPSSAGVRACSLTNVVCRTSSGLLQPLPERARTSPRHSAPWIAASPCRPPRTYRAARSGDSSRYLAALGGGKHCLNSPSHSWDGRRLRNGSQRPGRAGAETGCHRRARSPATCSGACKAASSTTRQPMLWPTRTGGGRDQDPAGDRRLPSQRARCWRAGPALAFRRVLADRQRPSRGRGEKCVDLGRPIGATATEAVHEYDRWRARCQRSRASRAM